MARLSSLEVTAAPRREGTTGRFGWGTHPYLHAIPERDAGSSAWAEEDETCLGDIAPIKEGTRCPVGCQSKGSRAPASSQAGSRGQD